MTKDYAKAAEQACDKVQLTISDGANHFDVVDQRPAFRMIAGAILSFAGIPAPNQ